MGNGFKKLTRVVVYSPPYRDQVGGIIVLHKLCATLAELGYEVAIWNSLRPSPFPSGIWRFFRGWAKYVFKRAFRPLDFYSPHGIKFATPSDLSECVVVYPETVKGNPLEASKVIRWLLNAPGVIRDGDLEFPETELLCYFNEYFMDKRREKSQQIHVNVVDFKREIYHQFNHGERAGCCYMVRKGVGAVLDQHPDDATCIDGLTHEAAAEAFNRCEFFVSYDSYTMYSRYAAMCGCLPVVVPTEGVGKYEWRPEEGSRLGVAYGWTDLNWARDSRANLFALLDRSERDNIVMVENMINAANAKFYSC